MNRERFREILLEYASRISGRTVPCRETDAALDAIEAAITSTLQAAEAERDALKLELQRRKPHVLTDEDWNA